MTPLGGGNDNVSNTNRKALRRNGLVLASLAALGLATTAVSAAPVVHTDGLEAFDGFIVKYRDDAARTPSALNARLQATGNAFGRTLRHSRKLATGAELVDVDGAKLTPAQARKLLEQFAKDSAVEYVQPNSRMYATYTPNDTRYAEQWHYSAATAGMNLPAAWDIGTGTGVTVAVIDTGITPHSDLSANVVAGYDFISSATAARDGNGRDSNPNDEGDWWTNAECGPAPIPPSQNSSWHGTHVAGTVAAVTNNASGVAGVAFGAKVQPVRVLGKCGGSLADIADAIIWASGGTVSGIPANPTPAKVINMSLGGGGACDSTYQNAINSAVSRGSVVVVAAGNSNADVSGFRPANCSNVVSVASLDRSGNRAYYSNYGTLIDVAAPGGETNSVTSDGVLSTLNTGTTTQGSATYAFYQGTSMAAPHVAGLAAMVLSKAAKTPSEMEALLKANVRAIPGSCSGGCGAGLVDALKTMQAATGGGGGGGTALQNNVPVTISAATGTMLQYTVAIPAGSSNLVVSISGGTGDADLYVKFGSAPTTTSYDCRPYLGGNSESCTFAAPSTGTYYVGVRAYAAFSGVTLKASWTAGGTQPSFFQNTNDYTIADNATVESPIAVSGRTGNAPTGLQVAVDIRHTYIGDLKVDLVAPDGSVYTLHNRTGSGTDNIITTYTVNASSEVANGTWKLRVNDNAAQDTGYINSWSLQF
jgi:serine protease